MPPVSNNKCIRCGRTRFLDSKWCHACYRLHHGLPRVFARSKEFFFRDFLQGFMAYYFGVKVHWNKILRKGGARRPDLFFEFLGRALVCVEIDESSHKTYGSVQESARVADILEACTFPLLVILRINPDRYSGGPAIWTREKRIIGVGIVEDVTHVNEGELERRVEYLKRRLRELLKEVALSISPGTVERKQLQVIRLFYD